MYPEQETKRSYEYLEKIVSILEEPICLIGGWAVFLTVNKNYKASYGKNYLGSRDIDLGFHLDGKKEFSKSSFAKAMKKLEEEGFTEIGGRMVKELDFDTGKELSKEEAQKKPIFEIHKMFVDLMVDHVPNSLGKKNKNFLLDEPLLEHVFGDESNREELEEFKKKIWLPKPRVLLATKIKALPNRQKEDKRQKDIADISALLLFTKDLQQQRESAKIIQKFLPKKSILNSLKRITTQEISATESLLGLSKNSFKATLANFIKKIENE